MDVNSNIVEIKKEYQRIDAKWLKLHYKTAVGLVLFAFLIECILGLGLYNTGTINVGFKLYILKYILSPLALNSIFIGFGCWVMRSSKFTQHTKIYVTSLIFVAICFVFYTVHCIYPSLYLIFIIPILLTIVYSDYRLTTVTSLLSISAKIVSEVFCKWDPESINTIHTNFGLINFIVSIIVLCIFCIVCLIVIRFEREKNDASIQKEFERFQLHQSLQTDELTQIKNRTALRKAFQCMEEDTADTSDNSYIFVMIDLDNFKMLNDTLGHDKGDQCLKDFGSILKADCKDAAPFRFGGDEFCILFKDQTIDTVINTCEKIQSDFKKIVAAIPINLPLTASFGIAHFNSHMTTTELLKNTDSALYRSKKVKNMICVYDDNSDAK